MTPKDNSNRLDRHEKVIEKLIEQVAQLQIANNIQNVINQANYASNPDETKDISDPSLRT